MSSFRLVFVNCLDTEGRGDAQVARHGTEHQAGSDSLLTADVFFALRSQFFDGSLDDSKYLGQIYGLGSGASRSLNDPRDASAADNDPLALPSDPLPSLSQPPGSVQRRQPGRGVLGGIFGGIGVGSGLDPPAPRASSAVSIKNPNALFTPASAGAASAGAAANADDASSVFSAGGRSGSPAVR